MKKQTKIFVVLTKNSRLYLIPRKRKDIRINQMWAKEAFELQGQLYDGLISFL